MVVENNVHFIFSVKNYALMYNPTMEKRIAFKNLSKPNQEEIMTAFASVVFNSGEYTINNDFVIKTQVNVAKVPGFESGNQFYRTRFFDKEYLELILYDETYPNGEKPEWIGKMKIKFVLRKE